jgi:ATP-binding cassette, subfamily F, member 1
MFDGLEFDSDSDSDCEYKNNDEEKYKNNDEEKYVKNNNLLKHTIKINMNNNKDNNDIDNNDEIDSNDDINEKIIDKVFKKTKNINEPKKNNINKNKSLKKVENKKTLFVEDVTLKVPNQTIINDSKIVINECIKYFVLGENGTGKTTLLNYLFEKLKENNDNILMLSQNVEINNNEQTCLEYILDSELQQKYLELIEIEQNEITNIEYYEELSNYVYEENNYEKYNAEAKKILAGLGINETKKVFLLSGGWRMRISLGKFLLIKPDVLFLDEPTNHLDLNAVIWLNDYLTTYNKTIIVASHNIGFIDNVSDVIWYINDKILHTIHGKYYKYKQFIDDKFNEKEKKFNIYQRKLTDLRNRKKPKPPSKNEITEFIKKECVEKPYKQNVEIEFNNVSQIINKNIIDFRDVSFNYGDKIIFKNIDFGIGMDSKIILVGNNGVGKTTLFKLCSGIIKETNGYIYKDERVKISYYHQHVIDNLPLDKTPIDYLIETYHINNTVCRNYLGKIGLKDKNICNLKIEKLSGGQKARIAWCSIQLSNPNIILMDEPTNHLDIETIEALINGINNYKGGFVIITHDTYLIENIENAKIYYVNDNNIKYFNRDFDEYCNIICDK